MLTGFKTILFNAGVAALVAALTYLVGVDWNAYVGPTAAVLIMAVMNIALRFFTNTPIFSKK